MFTASLIRLHAVADLRSRQPQPRRSSTFDTQISHTGDLIPKWCSPQGIPPLLAMGHNFNLHGGKRCAVPAYALSEICSVGSLYLPASFLKSRINHVFGRYFRSKSQHLPQLKLQISPCTASHFLFARAKEKVTKEKARPTSGSGLRPDFPRSGAAPGAGVQGPSMALYASRRIHAARPPAQHLHSAS